MEFINGIEGSSASDSKTQKITLTPKEYLEFTRKMMIV